MFRVHKTADGAVPPVEYLPAEAISPGVGLLLSFNAASNRLRVATTQAQYICMAEMSAEVTPGTLIPVIATNRDTIYETRLDGDTVFGPGDICDIDATGLLVDADGAANGDLLIVGMEGISEGNSIHVKFLK